MRLLGSSHHIIASSQRQPTAVSQDLTTAISAKALPLPTAKVLESSQSKPAFHNNSIDIIAPTILYLAYGSNLCYETFQGRRGIRPLSAINVTVPELELVFDLPGIPYIEPCFANSARRNTVDNPQPHPEAGTVAKQCDEVANFLQPSEESRALIGVVYEVTAADYTRILATEGSAYTDVIVNCHALPTPISSLRRLPSITYFRAHTLLAPVSNLRPSQPCKPAQPSLRYLTLCRNGAAEHGLPSSWQSYLQHIEHYELTSMRQKLGRVVFIATFGPFLILILGLRKLVGDNRGVASRLVQTMTGLLFKMCWSSYDLVYKHIFGDGERTEHR